MTADEVRVHAEVVLARALAPLLAAAEQPTTAVIVTELSAALVDAGLLAGSVVSWGIGLYPEDGGPVVIDESWLDRDTAVREVESQVEEFELDLRLYEIREGD